MKNIFKYGKKDVFCYLSHWLLIVMLSVNKTVSNAVSAARVNGPKQSSSGSLDHVKVCRRCFNKSRNRVLRRRRGVPP